MASDRHRPTTAVRICAAMVAAGLVSITPAGCGFTEPPTVPAAVAPIHYDPVPLPIDPPMESAEEEVAEASPEPEDVPGPVPIDPPRAAQVPQRVDSRGRTIGPNVSDIPGDDDGIGPTPGSSERYFPSRPGAPSPPVRRPRRGHRVR